MDICITLQQCSSLPLSYPPRRHLHIPLELWDAIVDCLEGDIASLRACALSCRTLLPRCRHHLFRRIVLKDAEHGHLFVRTLQRDLASADAVSDLQIGKFAGTSWAHAVLLDLLPMLSRLQKLRFRQLDTPLQPTFYRTLGEARAYLTTLALAWCHLEHPSVLKELILALPYVEHLSLRFLQFHDLTPIPHATDCHSEMSDVMLTTLYIQERAFPSWLEQSGFEPWLRGTSTTVSLGCLRLGTGFATGLNIVQDFVNVYKYTLHTLVLDFGYNLSFDGENAFISLSENIVLRRLCIYAPYPSIIPLANTLATVPPNMLEDLLIVITGLGEGRALSLPVLMDSLVPLRLLNDILTGESLKSLKRFGIHCSGVPEFVDAARVNDLISSMYLSDVDSGIWVEGLEDTFEECFDSRIFP